MPRVLGVVPVAAGPAARSWRLDGTPLVTWAVTALRTSGCVDAVVVAEELAVAALLGDLRDSGDLIVVLHDVFHPLAPAGLVRAVVDELVTDPGAVAAVAVRPVTDTLKWVGEDDVIIGTADRERYRVVCSPQAYRAAALEGLGEVAPGELPGSAAARGRLVTVPAPQQVFRVDGPDDLELAEGVLAGLTASDRRACPAAARPAPGPAGT